MYILSALSKDENEGEDEEAKPASAGKRKKGTDVAAAPAVDVTKQKEWSTHLHMLAMESLSTAKKLKDSDNKYTETHVAALLAHGDTMKSLQSQIDSSIIEGCWVCNLALPRKDAPIGDVFSLLQGLGFATARPSLIPGIAAELRELGGKISNLVK